MKNQKMSKINYLVFIPKKLTKHLFSLYYYTKLIEAELSICFDISEKF